MGKCVFRTFFCILPNKNDYKKQVLSIAWSLSVKKIQSEFRTNKLPSLRWYFPCAIQTENKFCHSNSVTFDVNKTKETLMTRLTGNTITITETKTFVRVIEVAWWKLPLNPWSLKTKISTFIPFPFSSGSEQSSQAGWHSSTCFCKKEHLLRNGYPSSWNEEGRMNARSWTIWRRLIGQFI